jgi:hypothetical protein
LSVRAWRDNAPFLWCSLVASGLMNVVPQRLLMAAAPGVATAWLAAILVASAGAAMAGVHVAATRRAAARIALPVAVATGPACALAVAGVLPPAAYLVLHAALAFSVNLLTQCLDAAATARAGLDAATQSRNDRIGIGLRFAGILLGPLCFGLLPGLWLATVLGPAWALAVRGAARVPMPGGAEAGTRHDAAAAALVLDEPPGGPADPEVRVVRLRRAAWSARAIYGGYCVLAASTLPLMSRALPQDAAIRLGGAVIATVYASAMAAIVVAGLTRREPSRAWLAAPAVPLAASTLVVALWPGCPPVAWFAGGFVLGLAFGGFMLAWRRVVREAATGARAVDRAQLRHFNDMPNQGALLGFAVLAATAPLVPIAGRAAATAAGAGLLAWGATWMARSSSSPVSAAEPPAEVA